MQEINGINTAEQAPQKECAPQRKTKRSGVFRFRAEEPIKLDFIGIGTQRSGTTWMWKCLSAHPEICMPYCKEAHLLNKEQPNLTEYNSLFVAKKHCRIRGEYTPNYLYSETALRNIKAYFPNAKIIVCLRNPTERALSRYYYRKSTGKNVLPTFEDEMRERPHGYLTEGRYSPYLKKYIEAFGREHIYIGIYEDMQDNPRAFINAIYAFLGVDPQFSPPQLTTPVNRSAVNRYRFPTLVSALKRLRSGAASRLPTPITKALKAAGAEHAFRSIRISLLVPEPQQKPMPKKLEGGTREQLRRYFAQDIASLETLLGRDLSFWK